MPRAQALLGPRQVGKSVLLMQTAERLLSEGVPAGNITYFDFSEERAPKATWIRDVVDFIPPGRQAGRARFYLLDEITRSPRWDLALKQMVDRARFQHPSACDRFLVTDSASSLLREGMRDSMQGRVDEHRIEGLSFSEFADLEALQNSTPGREVWAAANAERYLSRGGYPEHLLALPEVFDIESARGRLRADVHDRAIGRDLSRRGIDTDRIQMLFVALVQDSGGIFVAKKRAQDLDAGLGSDGTNERTVRSWLQMLEDACLVTTLWPRQPGPSRGSRHLRARPKVYASDHGMIPAFSPLSQPMEQAETRARTLEAAVFRQLRELARIRTDARLSYFRERERHELGFVVDEGKRSVGIEVTSTRHPDKVRSNALAAAGRADLDHLVIVHGGSEQATSERTTLVPWHEFLLRPEQALAL